MLCSFLGGIYLGNSLPRGGEARKRPASSTALEDAGVAYPVATPFRTPAAAALAGANPATVDADALLALADRRDDLRQALSALSEDDRWKLIDQLDARTANHARNEVVAAAFQIAAVDDPVRAVRTLAPMPASVFRTRLADEMVNTWAKTSPEAAARWLTEQGTQLLDPRRAQDQLARVVERWTGNDPQAAAKFLVEHAPGPGALTREALTFAAEGWARRNAQDAFEWAKSLPDDRRYKAYALDGALVGLAAQDPAKATAYVQQQLGVTPEAAAGMARSVAGEWAQTDPLAASQWAAALSDPAARSQALQQLAESWTQIDSQSAAQWAASLPAGDARGSVWKTLASAWSSTDSAGPDKWIASLPQGGDRDQAVAAYAGVISRAEPARALAWTQTLSDDRMYTQQAGAILREWQLQDSRGAARWASANGFSLPAEER